MTTQTMTTQTLLKYPAIAFHLSLESYGPTAIQLPTFQDIGTSIYNRPDGKQNGILDTHGSMANRLEAMIWDEAENQVIPCLEQMPFVTVKTKKGNLLTTSLHESHRLNSPYIFKALIPSTTKKTTTFEEDFGNRLQATDGDRVALAKLFAEVDPMSLIHGTFMSYSKKFEVRGGGAKITTALSGFAEATNIQPVEYGTMKYDRISASQNKEKQQTSKEGFGTFQTSATLWSPASIDAYFHIDIDLIRSYQLGNDFSEWAIAVCLLKILRFIDRGLRLRSRCILQAKITEKSHIDLTFKLPKDRQGKNYFAENFPQEEELSKRVKELTETLKTTHVFGAALELTDNVTNKE